MHFRDIRFTNIESLSSHYKIDQEMFYSSSKIVNEKEDVLNFIHFYGKIFRENLMSEEKKLPANGDPTSAPIPIKVSRIPKAFDNFSRPNNSTQTTDRRAAKHATIFLFCQ